MPPLTPANAEIRSRNVTASEVAALLGPHPYSTPASIFDRLASPDTDRIGKPSEAMALGSHMERPILRYAEERDGFRSRLNSKTFEHKRVRLCATPDAFQTYRRGIWLAERALIEIKMSARHDLWRNLPDHVAWQVRAQMACTNRDTAYVYALVGMRLNVFQVYRDSDKEDRMLEAVRAFWTDHILTGVRPAETITEPTPIEV